MSIELKLRAEQAAEAIDWLLNIIRRDAPQLSGKAMGNAEKCASALRAALSQQPATGEPVQADSSGHLRVIASLGAALRRLSFAAQTTGGTDGPDAELQSAIGQAEQALSLGGIWQAMSATPEPVKAAPYNPTEEMRWAMKRIDPALSSDQCRALWSAAWSAAPSAHPAPIVPDDVVRDAAQEAVEELHKLNEYAIVYINDPEWTRVSDTCQKLIGSIEKAMLAAAQAQKGGA